MALQPFSGFVGGSYQRPQPYINSERCVNLYPELPGQGETSRSQNVLLSTPGCTVFSTLPPSSQPIYALCTTTQIIEGSQTNPRTFAISQDGAGVATLYELPQAGGSPTFRGGLGPAVRYKIVPGTTQLLIVPQEGSSAAGYVFDLGTNTLTTIGAAGWLGASDIAFLDGYFFAIRKYSQKFYQSGFQDATSWNALEFTIENDQPDAIVAIAADHRRLWMFGRQRVEVWYNSGQPTGVTVARDNSASIEVGCLNQFVVAQLNNTLFWVGRDARGGVQAYKMNGFIPQRITTNAVEAVWQNFSGVDDAFAFAYQEEGHPFYVVTFPAGNQTWVYDDLTGFWHERSFLQSGVPVRWYPSCYTYNALFGGHFVGDLASTGRVYRLGRQYTSDNGAVIRRTRIAPHLTNVGVRNFYRSFVLDIAGGSGGPPVTSLRWSNDGGNTFAPLIHNTVSSPLGYRSRTLYHRLGSGRDRVFWVETEDITAQVAISGAYLEVEGGTH
jgi:hypothetical protein